MKIRKMLLFLKSFSPSRSQQKPGEKPGKLPSEPDFSLLVSYVHHCKTYSYFFPRFSQPSTFKGKIKEIKYKKKWGGS